MKNNVEFIDQYSDEENYDECFELDDNIKHYDDGERCICWDCDEARWNPKEPDWQSLPLFKDYVH